MLHTEDLTLILDTTKVIKGSNLLQFRFRILKGDLLELEDRADLSLRSGKRGSTFADRFELVRRSIPSG